MSGGLSPCLSGGLSPGMSPGNVKGRSTLHAFGIFFGDRCGGAVVGGFLLGKVEGVWLANWIAAAHHLPLFTIAALVLMHLIGRARPRTKITSPSRSRISLE